MGRVIVGRVIVGRVIVGRVNGYQCDCALKGLPTLRLEAWASWRGPHGVVCLVVTPDGVDGPTI